MDAAVSGNVVPYQRISVVERFRKIDGIHSVWYPHHNLALISIR